MEKRRQPRTRTLKKARIVFNDGRSAIDCHLDRALCAPSGERVLLALERKSVEIAVD
jgi:hypothetical protein